MVTTQAILLCVNMVGLYLSIVACWLADNKTSLVLGVLAVLFNISATILNLTYWFSAA
jgi:hypothetical protein